MRKGINIELNLRAGSTILPQNFNFAETYQPMLQPYDDEYFMRKALEQAHLAYEAGEVPVGAVVVCENRIIARGHNQTERLTDVTAHAEIIALTAASDYLGSKYLSECRLFVTLEPCVMCAGALAWAQLGELVYGASDEKSGFRRHGAQLLHPKTKVTYGVMETESSRLMKAFFRVRR